MKITVINKGSNRKPAGWCAEILDEAPLAKKS